MRTLLLLCRTGRGMKAWKAERLAKILIEVIEQCNILFCSCCCCLWFRSEGKIEPYSSLNCTCAHCGNAADRKEGLPSSRLSPSMLLVTVALFFFSGYVQNSGCHVSDLCREHKAHNETLLVCLLFIHHCVCVPCPHRASAGQSITFRSGFS